MPIRTEYDEMTDGQLYDELERRDSALRDFCWATFEKSIGYFVNGNHYLTGFNEGSIGVAEKTSLGYRYTIIEETNEVYRKTLLDFLSNTILLNKKKVDQQTFFEENAEYLEGEE